MDLSRRDFIRSTSAAAGAAAGASLAGTAAEAAKGERPMQLAQAMTPAPSGFNPADPALKYDLVIAGGEVLDPSQRLRGRMDIGIRFGQIAGLAPSITPARSVQRIDAAGKLVTPGLVDLHTHLVPHLGLGLPADELVPITATTTAVSAGDCGWHTFGAFKHLAVAQSRTRIFGFVHIASTAWRAGSPPARC
jgi:dihydroorotase